MANSDNNGLKTLAAGGAGIGVGLIIANLTKKPVIASEGGVVTLDQDTKNAIAAILEQQTQILNLLLTIDGHIVGINISGGVGYPSNTESAIIDSVACPVANVSYQLPRITIPNGMSLVIKAHPSNAIASFIYVATSGTIAQLRVWPLVPNESIAWKDKDASLFWVSTNVPGSIAVVTVEQNNG